MIKISEIFGPTIQGEGALIGVPTVFVRTGGCDYRCVWCDSLHAVDSRHRYEWRNLTAEAILKEIKRLSRGQALLVSLSGGNPAIQPLAPLIKLGHESGYKFAMETQGSICKDWFALLDFLVLSPKGPSSEMTFCPSGLLEVIQAAGAGPKIFFKFVIKDEKDYQFARSVAALAPHIPVYLQPLNHTPPPSDQTDAPMDIEGVMARMRWLIDFAIADGWYEATILPQLHTLIWHNKRGV